MGVHATYCVVCGLPVQHDHYVATERENYWAIYRSDNHPVGHFRFTSAHDWLLRGVAVSPGDGPHFGSCCDGVLEDEEGEEYYVGYDSEDYSAMHVFCWEAAGKPEDYQDVAHCSQAQGYTTLASYQQQLFDFTKCVAEGHGWLLIDPEVEAGARNKARIAAILGNASVDPS